ncbi:MAG TPA: hypothetical protein VFN09_14410 [Rhodanobacteraceae bacterium]|nr:hypothetical protein [Rhodanobacteraceae bacterium]
MLRTLIGALCFALAAALLALLAQQRVRSGLDHAAARELATWHAGHTPWDWAPRQPEDAIAGRAFGAAQLRPAPTGLGITVDSNAAFEVGVPLARPVPLNALPQLQLQTDASAPFHVQISLLDDASRTRITSTGIPIGASEQSTTIALTQLGWQQAGDGQRHGPPAYSSLLRLRLQAPAGSYLIFHALAWRTAQGAAPAIASIPRLALPPGIGAEGLLAVRDHLHQQAPMLLVASSLTPTDAGAFSPAPALAWALAALWLVLLVNLLASEWRGRHNKALALLQIAAVCLPWLILAIGLQSLQTASPALLVSVLGATVYAVLSAARLRPAVWHLADRNTGSWLWAFAPAALALLWAGTAAGSVTPRWPDLPHALTYAGWALLQQTLLLAVVASRWQGLLPSRYAAALATAVLFALLHTPNGMLMLLCLAAECWWAWGFLRQRALLPVALAHALAALALESVMPGLPLRSLEIGARFLQ